VTRRVLEEGRSPVRPAQGPERVEGRPTIHPSRTRPGAAFLLAHRRTRGDGGKTVFGIALSGGFRFSDDLPLSRFNCHTDRCLARTFPMKSPSLFVHVLLLAACVLPGFAQPSNPDTAKRFHFFLPDKTWSLDLDLRGFPPPMFDFASDLRAGKLATKNPESGLMVTAQITPAKNRHSAANERDDMIKSLRKGGFNLLDLKTYERDGRAYLEYTLKDVPKVPAPPGFQQRNVFVFIVQDGAWVDVHVSKGDFAASNAAGLDAFVSAVAINPSFQPTTMDFYLPGSVLYRRQNYRAAIPWLSRALDREKQEPTLPPNQHLILIDVLGMAHGISGDRKQARAVFTYGLSAHPEFPMFYYNLACTDAEDGDLDAALKNLRLTLQYRANMIPGEKLPDPTQDSSFKAYGDDPRFQEVARAFVEPSAP
jgi:tetratricopeptide (TPR) repeat protein